MMAEVWSAVSHAIWLFYAFGPQLAICLALAYLAARRAGESTLNWLAIGFLAAVVPLVGVLAMLVLYQRATTRSKDLSRAA
jgi:hypothetical protein